MPSHVVFAIVVIVCVWGLLLLLFGWLDHQSRFIPSIYGRIAWILFVAPFILLLVAGAVVGIYFGFFG